MCIIRKNDKKVAGRKQYALLRLSVIPPEVAFMGKFPELVRAGDIYPFAALHHHMDIQVSAVCLEEALLFRHSLIVKSSNKQGIPFKIPTDGADAGKILRRKAAKRLVQKRMNAPVIRGILKSCVNHALNPSPHPW